MRGRNEPHSARSTPLLLAGRIPYGVNSLDKRAVCTTGVELYVDAAVNDRATFTCGVSDVLSASWFGMGASSVTPSCLVSPTATRADLIVVSPSRSESTSQRLGRGETLLHKLAFETIVALQGTCTLRMR